MNALRRERAITGELNDGSSVPSFQALPRARCQTPTFTLAGSRLSLQSRPSPDGSSVEGVAPVEKKKKTRPLSALIGSAGRKHDSGTRRMETSCKSRPKRPQSAVASSPRQTRKELDMFSDTTSSVNVFKVTVRDAKITRHAAVPDWSSEVSSEISLGEKIEALARKNTVEFVRTMEEPAEKAKTPPVQRSAEDSLKLRASSFLPAADKSHLDSKSFRRKSDSALALHSSTDMVLGNSKHMTRVQEWIEEIQALDEEERRLEMKEAEAADALTVMSLEEEMMITRKPGGKLSNEAKSEAGVGADACVGTENSFDADMDGLEELIERCKREDGYSVTGQQDNNQFSENYYSILETLEMLEVKEGTSDAVDCELKARLSAREEEARYLDLPSPVDGGAEKKSSGGLNQAVGSILGSSSSGVVDAMFESMRPTRSLAGSTALDIPSRSSGTSFKERSMDVDGESVGFEGRSDVGGKTSEIFALLDQHAGLEPISKVGSHKPSFNGQYAGDYIDALGKISVMELELREKNNIIEDLKATLCEQRELLANNTKNANKELRSKLETQKKDYEETMKRHLNMIDQLIAEKRGLADRCEKLADEMKQMDKRNKDTVNSIEERHAAELRRIRSVQTSAEKLKRDRWIDDKTKEIKEMTVKGLEPEIQRILERHKAELEGVRAGHKAELREVEKRVKTEMNQEIERMKVDFHREKEMACMSEREIARQRLEKQFEEEEKLLQERRLKLLKQSEDEREKWEILVSKTRDEAHLQLENQRQKYELELFQLREVLAREEERRMKEKEDLMTSTAKEVEAEKARLNANFEASVDQAIKARARDLEAEKEKLTDDLRKEHLLDIEKLRRELGAEFETKLRRMKDKYVAEMEELENQEKAVHAKYFTAKSELTQVQEDLIQYKTSSNQFERELEAISKELAGLQEERKNMWAGIGTQFEAKIYSLEEECRKLRLDLSECRELLTREKRARENDRETLMKEKENEMEQVFKRVKFALDKKEEGMSQLKREYQEVLLRNQQLQSLLEKQGSPSASSPSSNRFRKIPSRQQCGKSP